MKRALEIEKDVINKEQMLYDLVSSIADFPHGFILLHVYRVC